MKTIKEVLEIEVEKCGDTFRADARVFSGTPPVGEGKTEYEALYDLLAKILFLMGRRHSVGGDSGYLPVVEDKMREFWSSI